MRNLVLRILLISLIFLGAKKTVAQNSTQKEIWPELEAYYKLNEKFRLYSAISGTKSNSAYTDGTAGIYIDFFALPLLRGKNNTEMHDTSRGYFSWFRMGYSYSDAPPDEKRKVVDIFETESDVNFRMPADIMLIVRNRIDWRWVNGDFQPIYRPRLKFVRNLKTEYLTFNAYLWSEYFLYWNDNSENRLRIAAGTVIRVLKWLDFEAYYMYQFQNLPGVSPVQAIGIQFDLYFSTKKAR
jgi:Protein of unknown function (DUF2490)